MKRNSKNNKKTNIIIKALTGACIVCAVALVGVIVMAFVGGNDELVTGGNVTPDFIETTLPIITTLPDVDNAVITTQPSVSSTAVSSTTASSAQKMVYATEDVNIRSGPSEEDELVAVLAAGEGVIFISVDEEGWCRVKYDGEICYIHRDYLTTKTTESSQTAVKTINPEHPRWYLAIVDKTRQIPEGYVPETDYVADSEEELDSRVVAYFDAMCEAALEDGIELVAYSGYRSYERQQTNYNNLVQEYIDNNDMTREEAEAIAATEILPPGCSEHHLGLAMDINGTDYEFIYTDEYAWLDEHAHEYGFIERYTEENQEITGIIAEPWHWRFVGPAHAEKIKNAGVTLEEYLQYYNVEY